MKAIIGCLNSKYVHASLAPWCLFAGIKAFAKQSHSYCVMESTINADTYEFADKIISQNPNAVSFSCYIWNITKTLDICKYIKEKTGAVIIVGGPEVSYRAKDVLESYSFIDFVLSGEGEESFARLLDALSTKEELCSVSGLSYRAQSGIISNPEKEYTGTPPSPFTDEFFENLGGRISYFESSRGCPFRCAFCLSGRCSALRFFDITQVKADLLRLANSGTQTIKFVDRTFNANAQRANEILLFIKENYSSKIPGDVCFHFEIAGDILTKDTLEILSQMPKGALQLEIGMQTFNEQTLLTINRKTNTKKLIQNIKTLLSFGNMHIHIDLIAGLTGEDMQSFKNSFNTCYSLKAHMLQMGFLKLLHGADMRSFPEKYPCEFSQNPPYEVISTPWLTSKEIQTLKKCEDALERTYNSGRFLFTLDFLLESTGLSPFDLFCEIGQSIIGENMPLCDYAQSLYLHFCDRVDSELLREKIVCDLLSCSSSLQIPKLLKRQDPLYKKIKKHFSQNPNFKIAILYKSRLVFVADQGSRKDFHSRFEGRFLTLCNFEGEINEIQ